MRTQSRKALNVTKAVSPEDGSLGLFTVTLGHWRLPFLLADRTTFPHANVFRLGIIDSELDSTCSW